MFGRFLLAGAVLFPALAGCDSISSPRDGGRLSLLLTDAPGDFAAAVVTIDKIYLQQGENGDQVVLLDTPTTANLLELQNEILTLVDDAAVPGGSYSQLRMVISGGYVEVIEAEDGNGVPTSTRVYASSPEYAEGFGLTAEGTLQMPSFAQSGLKINLPDGSVQVDGEQEVVLLDFDVAQSFGQQAGNSGMWVLNPVIRASDFGTSVGVEVSLALADGVTLPELNGSPVALADFAVKLTKGSDVLTESFADVGGTHKVNFYFLEADEEYPIEFVSPAGLAVVLDPAFPATVQVPTGTLKLAFEITSAAVE